jgi:hypothetical protein
LHFAQVEFIGTLERKHQINIDYTGVANEPGRFSLLFFIEKH